MCALGRHADFAQNHGACQWTHLEKDVSVTEQNGFIAAAALVLSIEFTSNQAIALSVTALGVILGLSEIGATGPTKVAKLVLASKLQRVGANAGERVR